MTLKEMQEYVKAHGAFPDGTVMSWVEFDKYSYVAIYVNSHWYTSATSHGSTPQQMTHSEFLQWIKKDYVSQVNIAMEWEKLKA